MYYPKIINNIAITLAICSVGLGLTACSKEATKQQEATKRLVEVIPVKEGKMQQSVGFTGNLYSKSEVAVVPRVSGQVLDVLAEEGDLVSEGQVLLVINDDLLQAQRKQLQANIQAAETQYQRALSGYKLQDSNVSVGINQADQGVLQAKFSSEQVNLNLQQAKIEFERVKRLFEKGAVSKQDMENSQLKYDTLVKQYDTAKSMEKNAAESLVMANANTIQKQLSNEDINAAKAQIEALYASLELLDININDCKVRAPFSGVISYKDKSVAKGAMVSPSPASPVFQLIDNSSIYMEGEVSEGVISEVKQGDPVKVVMDSYVGKTFEGKVEKVVNSVNSKSMAFIVKVVIENPDNLLKSGMFGRADIYVKEHEGIIVPSYAIVKQAYLLGAPQQAEDAPLKPIDEINNEDTYYLYVVENGKATRKNYKIWSFSETQYLLNKGVTEKDELKETDQIIITSVKTLQDEEPVEVTKTNK